MYKSSTEELQKDGEREAKRAVRLDNLAATLCKLRDEAIKGRAASGIEAEWLEDEEYYQGIDDHNRSERKIKPTSADGRVTIVRPTLRASTRSTVFVNITRPYVDSSSARVADMLLPSDDRNWDIRPTPVPTLLRKLDDHRPVMGANGMQMMQPEVDEQGQPVMAPRMMGNQPMMDQSGQPMMAPVMRPLRQSDLAKKEQDEAAEACESAKRRIDDWLTQCMYHAEARLVIEDSARIGVGILGGPFPKNYRRRAITRALEGIGLVIQNEILPHSRKVDPWNFYPDPSCGEDIQNGKYVFERDDINGRQLEELKNNPHYLADAIDRVIEEGPINRITGEGTRPKGQRPNDAEQYVIWYFHGYLCYEDLEAAGDFKKDPEESGEEEQEEREEEDRSKEHFPAICVMVNDTLIKALRAPLDSGEFPYDVMIWQRRAGHWAGIGVGRQMRTEQDGVNAATRNMMDNAGLAGGPIMIIDRSKIEPADGDWTIRPRKTFLTKEGETIDDIRKAITWIIIPSLQEELTALIQFWLQRAEDVTGLPMLMQGQLGRAPDTVGGMQMLNNNASSALRRIARLFDDRITERHIGRYYEYLLLHGPDDSEKGDFTIDARGSSALVERDAQTQYLLQMMGASLNPAYELDPAKVAREVLKSLRFDIKALEMDEEKLQQIQQGQPDPRVIQAQMQAEGKQMELQAKAADAEAQRAFTAQQADLDRALSQWEKSVDAQIEAARLNSDESMNLEELKVMLARDAMKLRAQLKTAFAKQPAPQMANPAMEPAGRAQPGKAFQQ